MNRFQCATRWKVIWTLLKAAPWLTSILIFLFGLLLVVFLDRTPDDHTSSSIRHDTFVGIAGSFFASTAFLLAFNLIEAIRRAPPTEEKQYHDRLSRDFGIDTAFEQRGSEIVSNEYQQLAVAARKRIWALGISNRAFLARNTEALLTSLSHPSKVDIRIGFADATSTLKLGWNGQITTLTAIQAQLEDKTPSTEQWNSKIQALVTTHFQNAPRRSAVTGTLSAWWVCSPCLFTCLVIDSHVFFFPMLARGHSGQDPTIQLKADSLLGKQIVEHMDFLLSDKNPFSHRFFSN